MGGHMRKNYYQESSNIKIHSLDDKDSAEHSNPLSLVPHFCKIKGLSCSWVLKVDFCLGEQQLPTLSEDWSPWISVTPSHLLWPSWNLSSFDLHLLTCGRQAATKFALWVVPSTVFYQVSETQELVSCLLLESRPSWPWPTLYNSFFASFLLRNSISLQTPAAYKHFVGRK